MTFLIFLVLIKTLRSTDGQITILQFCGDLIFLESRKIDVQFIGTFILLDISFHNSRSILSIQRILLRSKEAVIKREHIIK